MAIAENRLQGKAILYTLLQGRDPEAGAVFRCKHNRITAALAQSKWRREGIGLPDVPLGVAGQTQECSLQDLVGIVFQHQLQTSLAALWLDSHRQRRDLVVSIFDGEDFSHRASLVNYEAIVLDVYVALPLSESVAVLDGEYRHMLWLMLPGRSTVRLKQHGQRGVCRGRLSVLRRG